VLTYITTRALRPIRAPKAVPTPARHRFREALGCIHAAIDEAITASSTDPDHDSELIRLLLAARDPNTDRTLTRDEVVSNLAVFLIAGHDTTSTTLTYALWALGHHPEHQERVATEVTTLGDRPLTVEDLPALPFTVQVIHEALRLCPPAAAIIRLATQDTVVDGYRIDKGTNLLVGIYALHRDPALWDDPETFDPDRFSAARSRTWTAGSTYPSVPAPVHASATTSRCSRPPSALAASYDAAASPRSNRTSPWRFRSR
jgi:cytochrome P450